MNQKLLFFSFVCLYVRNEAIQNFGGFFLLVLMMPHKLEVLIHCFYIALKCNVDPLRSMFSGGAGHRARVCGTVLAHSVAGENESTLM